MRGTDLGCWLKEVRDGGRGGRIEAAVCGKEGHYSTEERTTTLVHFSLHAYFSALEHHSFYSLLFPSPAPRSSPTSVLLFLAVVGSYGSISQEDIFDLNFCQGKFT